MGKASFAVILDGKGTIQSYLSINDLGDDYLAFKEYDIGDIIGITDEPFDATTFSIFCAWFNALSCSLMLNSLLLVKSKIALSIVP